MDAQPIRRTTISAGLMIYRLISGNKELSAKITKVFPVAVEEATLPYIVYRRTDGDYTPVKDSEGADSSMVEVMCCAEDYDGAVDLAELTRKALDRKKAISPDMEMRSCRYVKSEDLFEDDAYVVRMIFKVSIG